MESGTVTRLNLDRGFGFIRREGGKLNVFFHFKDIGDGLTFDESLQERRVRFDVEDTEKGPRAVNVCAAE